jgi:HEAT repeat protein
MRIVILLTLIILNRAFGLQASPDPIERLASGSVDRGLLHSMLYHKQTPERIAALKEAFNRFTSDDNRSALAETLVRLGERENMYFMFLSTRFLKVLSDDAPFCMLYDERGKSIRAKTTPAFDNWCALHKVDPGEQSMKQLYEYPIETIRFAELQDPRAASLLGDALDSSNPLIVRRAVDGLALLGKSDMIDHILTSLSRFPHSASQLIGMGLVGFTDPRAITNFNRIIPSPATRAFAIRELESRRFQKQREVSQAPATQR